MRRRLQRLLAEIDFRVAVGFKKAVPEKSDTEEAEWRGEEYRDNGNGEYGVSLGDSPAQGNRSERGLYRGFGQVGYCAEEAFPPAKRGSRGGQKYAE